MTKRRRTVPHRWTRRGVVRTYSTSLPSQRFSNLKEVADYFAITDQDARFDRLLDLFVEGIAARAAQES